MVQSALKEFTFEVFEFPNEVFFKRLLCRVERAPQRIRVRSLGLIGPPKISKPCHTMGLPFISLREFALAVLNVVDDFFSVLKELGGVFDPAYLYVLSMEL